MVKHDFKVVTQWKGGRNEIGTVQGDLINEQISILFFRWSRHRYKS